MGLIIPRLIIANYGSEANGLLSSVNNIFTYIALIEAGIGTAAAQGLYKPISENDRDKISEIVVATQNYYHRLIKWYALAVLVFASIYPLIIQSDFSYLLVFGIIFVQGISHIFTYYFASTLINLLTADGREYVSQIVGLIVFVLNSILKIILLAIGSNLIIVQCGYLFVNLFQILIYKWYINKKYSWLNWGATPEIKVFAKRKHFLLNGVAWTVFNATDTIILSIICGLVASSIYSVYNLVFANLNMIITIMYSSSYFLLGQMYHRDKEKYLELHDGMESLTSVVMFSLLSVAYLLIIPFIKLYTNGISDVQYVDKYLPILFCLVQIFSNCRLLSGNLINICNQPQIMNKHSIIEVSVNIIISLILAYVIGIYGVLMGTIIGLLYKTNIIIIKSNKLLNRSAWRTYKIFIANMLVFIGIVIFNHFLNVAIESYVLFFLWAIIYMVGTGILFLGVNIIINPVILKTIKLYLLKRSK